MPGFEFVEELSCRPEPSLFHILQSLPNAFLRISSGRDIEQALISFGILNNCGGSPVDGQDDGRLLFFSCLRNSPDRRRKVVSDWMSSVISSMAIPH